MGEVPSQTEMKKGIWRMRNNKVPRKPSLTTNTLKNLLPKGFYLYVDLIQNYWKINTLIMECDT
jgi:hypothetical protein